MKELFFACIIGPLLLVLGCSGYELCDNYRGSYLTKLCANDFCCGTRTYRYCCSDCVLRYPRLYDCDKFSTMKLSSMQITWLVVGFILLLKGIIAVIYLCCCRKPNRRSVNRTNNVVDTECGTSPTHIPYDPNGPGAPPSYEDLVKDGVLNNAYTQDSCAQEGAPSGAELSAPPNVPSTGLPAPPPYSEVNPQTSRENPPSEEAPAPSGDPQVPR